MEYAFKFLGVMVAMIATDVCWTVYFMKVEERRSIGAGLWSSAIMFCGAMVTLNYVDDISLLGAALIGAFIGTSATVEYKKRRERKEG